MSTFLASRLTNSKKAKDCRLVRLDELAPAIVGKYVTYDNRKLFIRGYDFVSLRLGGLMEVSFYTDEYGWSPKGNRNTLVSIINNVLCLNDDPDSPWDFL